MTPEEWTENLKAATMAVFKMDLETLRLLEIPIRKRQQQLAEEENQRQLSVLPWQLRNGSVQPREGEGP